jgi:hypothetical protein
MWHAMPPPTLGPTFEEISPETHTAERIVKQDDRRFRGRLGGRRPLSCEDAPLRSVDPAVRHDSFQIPTPGCSCQRRPIMSSNRARCWHLRLGSIRPDHLWVPRFFNLESQVIGFLDKPRSPVLSSSIS